MAEVLRTIIAVYREVFKAAALTDALLFSNYALAALVVDEVCREVRARLGGCSGGRKAGPEAAGCAGLWGRLVVPLARTHTHTHTHTHMGAARMSPCCRAWWS